MSFSLPKDIAYYLTPTDQLHLTKMLTALPIVLRNPLLHSVQAAAMLDARAVSALLPLLGPILSKLPLESRAVVLERVAALAQRFPAVVVPLLRSLDRVFDEVGEERTLAWIDTGEEIARRGAGAGAAFFALKSRTSILTLRGAFPHVYLSDVQGVLLKYLHMLSGEARGFLETEQLVFPPPLAEDAGEMLLLPFCIARFPTYEENFRLYRVLVAHQIGRVEFGTYACAPSRLWASLAPLVSTCTAVVASPPDDLPMYFRLFPRPDLIQDLFLAIDGKRVAARIAEIYPGLHADLAWADALPSLQSPIIAGALAHVASATWTTLGDTGTADDSLLLATRLYARFFRLEAAPVAPTSGFFADDLENAAEEGMGFITGAELGRGGKASSESEKDRAARQRRPLTTADLRYVYDEWDFEIEDYRPHWCEVREVPLLGDGGAFFAKTLTTYADLIPSLKQEFQKLRPRMPQHVKGLEDGEEIDLNAVVAAHVERRSGRSPSLKLYTARQLVERDVAVLLLLDLSASTAVRLPADAAASSAARAEDTPRVIDLIKEAVTLLAVSLEEIGDAYAIYGFSSGGRHDVEVYPVKTFKESLLSEPYSRIGGVTPRGSTRMGAAVRHATRRLKGVSSRTRLLVVLSDGYPEDEDYGKPVVPPMYGLRDTLTALREAERSGITSFFLTIDKGGHDYLREMCPSSRYLVIEDVRTLPTELPKIYQRHIWSQWT
ncbi:MAG: VWA domain-containing protein [Deltaproteobacteria bacterium]|nr:VWA domain-containing protein [Deltaproteobacteria bacterium]